MTFVYFVRCNDRVKIGFSADPARRLAALSTGNAYPLVMAAKLLGTARHEKLIHKALREHRLHREWFAYAGVIPEIIDAVGLGLIRNAADAVDYLGAGQIPPAASAPRPFDDVFGIWPSVAAMAGDLGVGMHTAQGMRTRGTITARHWPRITSLPAAKTHGITTDVLFGKYMETRARKVAA